MTAPLAPRVEVSFGTKGVEGVQRGLKLVGATGESTGRQVGGAMRQIAGGAEMIARQGKVTGEALKQIVAQGAEMAFMFGAGGPIVGAFAIVGLAIYQNVTNRMQEAREEINKTRGAIEDIRRSTDLMDVGRKQQGLFSGDPAAIRKEGESAAVFLARSRGLEGVRSRMDELMPGIPNNILEQIARGKKTFRGGAAAGANDRYNEFAELFGLQGGLEQQFATAQEVGTKLGQNLGEGLKRGLSETQKKADADAPLSLSTVESSIALNDMLDAILKRGVGGVQLTQGGGTQTTTRLGGLEGARAFGLKAADLGDQFKNMVVNPLAEQIRASLANGLGDAISAGFDAAFAKGGNIGKAAAAFGAGALSTLGGVFKQIGIHSLIGLKFMAAIEAAIKTFNPTLGIVASLGLIAFGSMLQSAGSRVSANASGGGSGGGASSTAPAQIIDRGFINPSSTSTTAANMTMRSPVNNFVTFIGPNDPQAQRMWRELQRNSERRENS